MRASPSEVTSAADASGDETVRRGRRARQAGVGSVLAARWATACRVVPGLQLVRSSTARRRRDLDLHLRATSIDHAVDDTTCHGAGSVAGPRSPPARPTPRSSRSRLAGLHGPEGRLSLAAAPWSAATYAAQLRSPLTSARRRRTSCRDATSTSPTSSSTTRRATCGSRRRGPTAPYNRGQDFDANPDVCLARRRVGAPNRTTAIVRH